MVKGFCGIMVISKLTTIDRQNKTHIKYNIVFNPQNVLQQLKG